jgi:hypothetical protein
MIGRFAVRVLSSDGVYPVQPLVINGFAILAAEDFAWCAVDHPDLDDSHSERPGCRAGEISWLTPDEIRFFGAVSIAEPHPRTNGRLLTYTSTGYGILEVEERLSEDANQLIEQSRAVATRMLDGATGERRLEPDTNQRPTTIPRDYTASVKSLLEAMDAGDPLLYRGLYKLLMASELRRHPKFLEESALSALISREAALELLRRKLSSRGGARLSKEDVFEHIESTFPTGEPFVEVLHTDWEARIMITHPVSEYGEHWSPPVEAEECFDALTSLTYLYRYLLLDEVWTPGEFD